MTEAEIYYYTEVALRNTDEWNRMDRATYDSVNAAQTALARYVSSMSGLYKYRIVKTTVMAEVVSGPC